MQSIKDIKIKIEELISQDAWSEAYKLTNQILDLDPENSSFLKLKKRIEVEVRKRNEKAVNTELDELEVLLKEKKYQEYLTKIAPLQIYITDFAIIGVKIVKAKKLMDQSYSEQRNKVINDIEAEINTKKEALNFEQTLTLLDQFDSINFDLNKVNSLKKKVKNIWIEKLMRENQGLFKSEKYEDIIIFLLKLKKIDETNQKILNLISKTKDRYQEYRIESQKDFIFKTIEEIKTLYIKKSYDKANELCERILLIDEKNLIAKNYAEKSSEKARVESEKQIFKQIKLNYSKFKSDPAIKVDFIKI